VAEPVHLRAMAVVRLVRALALGHGRSSFVMERGPGGPARRQVYGRASAQDKALDKRKSVKTPVLACGVEKARAIVRGAFPPGTRRAAPRSTDEPSRRRYPPVWKGPVE
jgi:hypothetical protein